MSALDLFAMLNAPLPGNGAGASVSARSDGMADSAFAGLLAMMAPKGDGTGQTATAPTSASVGLSLTPFRFNDPASPALPDEAPSDDAETRDADDAGLDPAAVVQAGLAVPTPTAPLPSSVAPIRPTAPAVSAAAAAPPGIDAPPDADAALPPAEAEPTHPPVLAPAGERATADSRSSAAATGPADANALFQSAAPQVGQTSQAAQAAPVTPVPLTKASVAQAPQPGAAPLPATTGATPQTAAEANRTAEPVAPLATAAAAAVIDEKAATESPRAAGQQTAAAAPSADAARLAQPRRPDAAQSDRRGERRDGDTRSTLFAATDSSEPFRPSAAPAASPSAAVTAAPTPGPGAPQAESRVEPGPLTVDAAPPEGEAAPEPARTSESQTTAALREHLPSTLSRAGVETTAMLSAQIVRRLEARSTRFDMVLTPEDLGRVDVRMEVDSDGQLTARLAFDNPAAAAELRGRADELRRQLEAAGFQMSEGSLEFAEREGGRRDQPFDQRDRAFAGAGRLANSADALSTPPRWTALSLTPDGVDMKV